MDTDVDSNTAIHLDSRTDSIHTNLDSQTFGSINMHTHAWTHTHGHTRMDTDVDSNTATHLDSRTDSIHTNLDSHTFGSTDIQTHAWTQTLTPTQSHT